MSPFPLVLEQAKAPKLAFRRNLFFATIAVIVVIGVAHSISLRYVNDDCFVSFRYAKNLVDGKGLVYNVGERVEGYTNFLWTIIIALGMKTGIDPVPFSMTFGIACSVLTLLLYAALSWHLFLNNRTGSFFLPLTSLVLSLHRDFNAHATSGMETSLFTFLISLSLAIVLLGNTTRRYLWAGGVLTLAMMTRPDGIIFFSALLFFVLISEHRRWLAAGYVALLPLLVFLPYWLWRYSYFGYFFPNTFYAKSIDLPYYSQGSIYAWLYFKTYYVFIVLPILAAWFFLKKRKSAPKIRQQSDKQSHLFIHDTRKVFFLCSSFAIAYTCFVVRIGGDFMFARLFIVVTPVLVFCIELLLHKLRDSVIRIAVVCILLVGTYFRNDQFSEQAVVGYIADEQRYFTTVQPIEPEMQFAERLRKYFDGLPIRIGFWAGQLRLVYYLDPLLAVECSAGLTDTTIAHQSLAERGRPGHEKNPTFEYLLERNVHFYLGPTQNPPPGQPVVNLIYFGNHRGRIITYHSSLMAKLARFHDVRFISFPDYLDEYLQQMYTLSAEQVQQDFVFFQQYYFNNNDDFQRMEQFAGHPELMSANLVSLK